MQRFVRQGYGAWSNYFFCFLLVNMPFLMIVDFPWISLSSVHKDPKIASQRPGFHDNITLEDIERWTRESGLPLLDPEAVLQEESSRTPSPDSDSDLDSAPMHPPSAQMMTRLMRGLAFASIAYCPANDSVFGNLTSDSHFIKSFHSSDTDTYAYIAVQKPNRSIIIGFRGTQSLLNWFNDFKFLTRPLPWKDAPDSAFVHRGFFTSYASVSKELISILTNVVFPVYPDYSIDIVGHSLGGAMATLCSLDLKVNVGWQGPISVFTYGQPRVGNHNFSNYYNSHHRAQDTTLRVINYSDMITHVPPLRLGYIHRVQEVWIQPDGTTTFLCSFDQPEDPLCSSSLSPSQYSITHHSSAWNISFGICLV